MLKFPTSYYDGCILSERHCLSQCFKKLVALDFPSVPTPLKCGTKLFVLIKTSPQVTSTELSSKAHFKFPKMGKVFEIDFTCNTATGMADLSHANDGFDISGIEPLSNSFCDMNISENAPAELKDHVLKEGINDSSCSENHNTNSTSGDLATHGCTTSKSSEPGKAICSEHEQQDHVWFQIDTQLSGFEYKK